MNTDKHRCGGLTIAVVLGALCVLCGSSLSLRAQAPPAGGSLQALEPFIGGTWVAEGEIPGLGKYVAARTYRRALKDTFIEFEQVLKAGESQSTVKAILGWHPGKKRVVAWGFADDGTISMTECDCAAADAFTFQGRLIGGRNPGPVRGHFRWTGADSFTEVVEVERNGGWQKHGQFEFKRGYASSSAPPAAAPAESLKALEPLVGTWTQTTTYTNGTSYTVELEFRWILGGRFLMSEYSVLGTENAGVHAVSFIGYDEEEKRIVQYGFSADGAVGTFHFSAAGAPELVFEGEMLGGQRRSLRIRYQRRDEDTLSAITEFHQRGIFQPMTNSTMRRKKAEDRD
jgi:hypothetical protein